MVLGLFVRRRREVAFRLATARRVAGLRVMVRRRLLRRRVALIGENWEFVVERRVRRRVRVVDA
jgi:hypothetical protein